jgi:catechol 2,3-dioxygenase-like lactoylglutathione lyase family enzyme
MEDNPSILNHVSIGVIDVERSGRFYDAVLATIGAKRIMEHEDAIAYGKMFPEFWVQSPADGGKPETANGSHFSFSATSKEEVDAFYAAALAQGARDNGPPGPRPMYGEPYYGCFAIDPDGHKIEATFWDNELAEKLEMG